MKPFKGFPVIVIATNKNADVEMIDAVEEARMSYSESYRDVPAARSTGREAVRVAGRAVLIASAAILGDVLLFGFVLVYAGVFEF
jgi:hypothetical protein